MRKDDASMATDDDMCERIQRLKSKFDDLEKKIDRLPTKDDLDGFKDEIIKNCRILVEDAKDSAKQAAEGYGATLQRIETDLGKLNRKMDTKLSDHDRVLANYNERLLALEPHQRA